ncbi:MAG: phage major capsid protein, partial [Afipia sp.]
MRIAAGVAACPHMPFTPEQIAYAGKAAIDYYLKNEPIDNINIERPLIKKLMEKKREYAGGLQYVVEQLRYSNDSNFQSYFGDQQVTYNRKRTLQQAKYQWGSFHDGFGLNEDELAQNGITMTDDREAVPTDAEKVQLTNLLKENNETLKLGFQENFDIMLHLNGDQDPEDIPGLDALVSLDPDSGTVGGLDPSTNEWWRNYADPNIAWPTESLAEHMEVAWRACIRVGGMPPDFLLVGSDFLDAYRTEMKTDQGITRQVILGGNSGNTKPANLD